MVRTEEPPKAAWPKQRLSLPGFLNPPKSWLILAGVNLGGFDSLVWLMRKEFVGYAWGRVGCLSLLAMCFRPQGGLLVTKMGKHYLGFA